MRESQTAGYSPPSGNSYDVWWIDPYYPYYPSPYQIRPSTSGWVCPKCGASNAPHVNQCPCSQAPYISPWGWTHSSSNSDKFTVMYTGESTTITLKSED